MESNNKRYWKGLEELSNDLEFVKNANEEFPHLKQEEGIPSDVTGSNRRDFLKMMGFGVTAVSLAACEAPVKKAIPYLNKPEDIDPTISNYYASSYVDSNGGYDSILVETREGRPIKIEPNNLSSLTRLGTSVRAQASPLSLYDNARLKGPAKGGKLTDWNTVDSEIGSQLQRVASQGGAIRIVSSTIISPSTSAVIRDFIAKYPTAQHVVYDANSFAAVLKANQASYGQAVVPTYNFENADVVVGIGAADFLGTWPGSTEYSYQYAQQRKLGKDKKQMSRHYQFETTLSITGANADHRTPIKPSQEGLVVAALYNQVAKLTGGTAISAPAIQVTNLDKAAADLVAAKGRAVVISGSKDVNVQIMTNAINNLIGANGQTIDFGTPSNLKAGDDTAMATFVQDVQQGKVAAVIFYNANPVYDYPTGKTFGDNLQKVGLRVSFADRLDETASLCQYVCPDHHYLESWGDAEPKRGYYSVIQPTINPIFKTRAAQASLLTWAGASTKDHFAYLQNFWRTNIYPQAKGAGSFENFWTKTLHDGVFEPKGTSAAIIQPGTSVEGNTNDSARPLTQPAATPTATGGGTFNADINAVASAIGQTYKANANATELVLYEKSGIGNGDQANNPYLQEFPDPISRACWDNYLAVPKKMAIAMELEQGDKVKVEGRGYSIEIPVLIQPGQAEGTVALAIGYGREKAGKAGNKVGKNAYPFASLVNGTMSFVVPDVKISKAEGKWEIAQVQTHHTIMARPVVQEANLKEYQQNPAAGSHRPMIETSEGPKTPTAINIWKSNGHKYPNHSWGMVIDMNSCTGCGACVVACNVENNVPVVGRQEVINRREMHWLRIDRYYSTDPIAEETGVIEKNRLLEEASANPEVVFQPMLCQHCQQAPCETVCPVLATTHSTEGLNQMTYNRCIGTRYCANNCPYKVRRLNWFKYHNNEKFDFHMNNDLGKMVLNPDVTVRARGVMEKCSFCVQRIQEGKLNAKKERRRPKDGEIITACAQSCATGAIVFGDLNDPETRVAQMWEEENGKRGFRVLEEINVRPQITYLTKIRNKA